MFSYQHRYHAGGLADVHKHLCLIALLESFLKKEKPFAAMDAYAGDGVYDLSSVDAQKTKEYQYGIQKVLEKAPYQSPLIQHYLSLIHMPIYPGSASIIASMLKPTDRKIFVEKHPQALQSLRTHFKGVPNIHIHERFAEEAMMALVPFAEKRGLIFIDPSFEVKSEYHTLVETIFAVQHRFSQVVIALWYPILESNAHELMIKKLVKANPEKTWKHEWMFSDFTNQRMLGSGMLIINPPWKIEESIIQALKELSDFLI